MSTMLDTPRYRPTQSEVWHTLDMLGEDRRRYTESLLTFLARWGRTQHGRLLPKHSGLTRMAAC